MILLTLLAAFLFGVAAVYWILTPLQRAWWRRHDRRRAAEQLARKQQRHEELQHQLDDENRLLRDLRRICEPLR